MELKKWMRKFPLPACIAAAVLSFVLLGAVGLVRKLFPESILIDYVRQFVNILWPLALTLVLGYGWCYRRGSFGRTLLAGACALVLCSFAFVVRAVEAIVNEQTPWKPMAGIILGIISILGVGFREETLFRGIISGNLGVAYGKDLRGVWKAVILSGLIFGLAHLTNIFFGANPGRVLIQVISACALGMYFTAVYFRGGNIWALMLIHSIIDAGGLFQSAFTTEATQVQNINNLSMNGLIMVPINLGITIFLLRKKKMGAVFENIKQMADCDQEL